MRLSREQIEKRVVACVVEIDRLRGLKAIARKARWKLSCPHESRYGSGGEKAPPCWRKTRVVVDHLNYDAPYEERIPRSEWCDSCIRRQAAHDRFMEITRTLAAKRAALTRYARALRNGGPIE